MRQHVTLSHALQQQPANSHRQCCAMFLSLA